MTDPRSDIEKQLQELRAQVRLLENTQRTLDVHVAAIENSLIFRFLRTIGKPILEGKARLDRWLRPFRKVAAGDAGYQAWFDRCAAAAAAPGQLGSRPLFSIVLRVQNPERAYLTQAVESVIQQTYPNWELCLDPADSNPGWVEKYLQDLRLGEPRIRVGNAERGDYFAFLHQHGMLSAAALECFAAALQEGPVDLIYSDEDRLNAQGRHVSPVFKPDWSPELLLSCAYIGGLMAVSREALQRTGGLRESFGNAAEYDLALRLTDGPAVVRHVPFVLYHGRAGAEGDTHDAGRRALEEMIRRRHWNASVENGLAPDRYHIRWRPQGDPLASLIICSRSPRLLAKCLEAIKKRTAYARREVIVVQHLTGEGDAAMEKVIQQYGAARVAYDGPFHFSRMNNLAAKEAHGEILVFLNDDVEPLADGWLADLMAQAQRPEIGAVGARLLYPSGALQHGGITIGIGDGCGHAGRGTYARGHWPWLDATRNVAAVTGACLAIRKQVFEEVGGFDDRFPVNYNDADLCLRIARAGYRIVYEASALLRHYECQTRRGVVTFGERKQWYSLWADELDRGDPFYSPNLTKLREDAGLRCDE